MTDAIITALISAAASLIVAFGTWHFSMKKDREKQTEEVKELLIKHREEYLLGIQDVKKEVASVKATVELNQAVTNEKIDTLSERVDKHNSVIERTFQLEKDSALHSEQIANVNKRVDNLEDK